MDTSEADANEVDAQTARKGVRWPRAAEAAARAGLSKLGPGAAYFDVRLEHRRADVR
jgi:hypothetical protein